MISIIIVNWNGKKWIKKCLDSLQKQTYKDFEIIFVDNASTDDSIVFVKSNYPNVNVVQSKKNGGFAYGNNLGIKEAKGEYILLLNNDTWVETDFLESLFADFKKNKNDILSPLEDDYDGKKGNYYSITVDPFGHPVWFPYRKDQQNFYLTGVCLFFRKDFYIKTKGLDNNFFMYCEELDWFWRLNLLKKSWAFSEKTKVYHAGSNKRSSLRYDIFLWRNQNAMQTLIKNYKWYNLLWVLPLFVAQNIVEILFFLLLLKPQIAFSYINGWVYTISTLGVILKNRKWVQDNRKIGDFTIMKKMYMGSGKLRHLLQFIS